MSRSALILLAALLTAAGCARPADPPAEPSEPRADERRDRPRARQLAVAPPPRAARPRLLSVEDPGLSPEKDLTNEDPGLRSNIEAALPAIERLDEKAVEAVVAPDDLALPPIGPQALLTVPAAQKEKKDEPAANVAFPGRVGATKTKLLEAAGGTEASEQAVARGLAWLARQQKPDGSWAFDGTSKEVVAATGMALLPFLAAGETHRGKGKYAKTVGAGLGFLVKNCPVAGPNAGVMSTNMYAQGIAALALCEAYGMTKDKAVLLAPAQAAVNAIQKAQGQKGGWGYGPQAANHEDTSILGWQMQALHAAQLSKDLKVDPKVLKKAVAFLDAVAGGERKAVYGYTDNAAARPGSSLTAIGLWCRHHADGWGPENAGMREGVPELLKRAAAGLGKRPDTYFLHYAAQVVRSFGGDEWAEWNEGKKQPDGTRKGGVRDWLVDQQVKKAGPTDGSWEPDGGFIGPHCGRVGTTALCVLTLEVYYRHAPPDKPKAADGPKP